MLRHAQGLAASPLVSYKLFVGGARRLLFCFWLPGLFLRAEYSALNETAQRLDQADSRSGVGSNGSSVGIWFSASKMEYDAGAEPDHPYEECDGRRGGFLASQVVHPNGNADRDQEWHCETRGTNYLENIEHQGAPVAA